MDIYSATEEAYKKGYADGTQNTIVKCENCKYFVQIGNTPNSRMCVSVNGLNNAKPYDFCSRGKEKDT